MTRRAGAWAAALVALLAPVLAPIAADAQIEAPHVSARSIAWLPYPLPAPYDPARDARADVAAARARAKAGGKMLLVDLGANWCVDCRILAGVMALPEMRPWLAAHFVTVTVDIGQFDRNLDLARQLGVPELRAVPALLMVDPRSGKLRNKDDLFGASDGRTMKPQQIADWLAHWAR